MRLGGDVVLGENGAKPSAWAVMLMSTALSAMGVSSGYADDRPQRPRADGAGASIHAKSPRVQVAQGETQRAFDIAAQPLASALAAFGQQSGTQISYPSGLAEGLRSQPVSGTYLPEEALRRLLTGTGVTWRVTSAGTIVLEKATASSTGAYMLDPVTVRSEKTDRSLQNTATSVAVFDAPTIEQRPRITSTNDVLERIPNVTSGGTTNFAPAVRGVDGTGPAQGANAFLAGIRPRLNLQVDGRPTSFNELVFGDVSLWDVEQVEVLRGPQSTLQGRNAIAGTIAVRTKDPTYQPEISLRGIGGNFDHRQLSGAVSGPIIQDQLALRFAFDRRTSESFAAMTSFPGVQNPAEFESLTLRGKMLVEPKGLEGFSTLLTLNHTDVTGPQTETVAPPFGAHVSSFPAMPVFRPSATSGIIETKWALTDNYTFENTLSLTDTLIKRLATPGDGNAKIDGREVLFEPRLRFAGLDGRLNGIGGVHFFEAAQDESIDLFGGSSFDDETTTAAAFGEATLAVLGNIDLTAGGRFERENRRRTGAGGPFIIDFDKTYEVFLPKAGVAWHATEQLTFGTVVSRGYNGGGAGFTFEPPLVSYAYDAEYVWNYEAYVRADLYDGKLRLNGNVFYGDYKNMQLPFNLSPLSTVIRNAEKAVTYGSEIGAKWLALPGLQLFAEIGLLQTEIKSFPGSGFEGNELSQSPALTADFGVTYQHESGVEASVDGRYSEAYFSDIVNTPRGKVDPYWIFNAQLAYNLTNVRLFAFVTNLFNAGDAVLRFPDETPESASILRPRTVGVGLQMTF
jgi:iron complex outermembrane receptor protein